MKNKQKEETTSLTKEQIKDIAWGEYFDKYKHDYVNFEFYSKIKQEKHIVKNNFRDVICMWNLYNLLIWRLRFDFSPDVELKYIKMYLGGKHITIDVIEGNDKISKLVDGHWVLNLETRVYFLKLLYTEFLKSYKK